MSPSIDPVTALAVSMEAKKGVFALLLGSGVSRSAGIPTGQKILLNLIEQVAEHERKTTGGNPEEWYRETYRRAPNYSDVLDELTKTPAQRSQIIRRFVEPNDEEREQGLKQPTPAHRAIASLVVNGYVRVIVTTNFDRLLEVALGDVGIVPSVISSVDGISGTLPLVHNDCTIIKVHGDYVDARIRNTTAELEAYPEEINTLLQQVFREYGLVICGWSGEWDTALRQLLLTYTSPWFPTYWVSHGGPKAEAQEIIAARHAGVITHMDADSFFQRIAENVISVEELRTPELLSIAIAEASLKRYIDDPTKRIRIRDLVVGEANRVRQTIEDAPPGFYFVPLSQKEVDHRLKTYEDNTSMLRALFTTGCYWGNESQVAFWVSALERLASFSSVQGNQNDEWTKLRYYPGLLTIYAGGLASLANNQYKTLRALLYGPTSVDPPDWKRKPLILTIDGWIMADPIAGALAPNTILDSVLPQRIRHQEGLWKTLREYVPANDQFENIFDLFEYFFGLVQTDLMLEFYNNQAWPYQGLLPFQGGLSDIALKKEISDQIQAAQQDWPPLRAGMFGGSMERLITVKAEFDGRLRRRIV